MTLSNANRERCEGCDRLFAVVSLTDVEMEYGDTERLCRSCIEDSAGIIAGVGGPDE